MGTGSPGASTPRPLRCHFCLWPGRARPLGTGQGSIACTPLCNLGRLERGDPLGWVPRHNQPAVTCNLGHFGSALLVICFTGLHFAVPAKYPGRD